MKNTPHRSSGTTLLGKVLSHLSESEMELVLSELFSASQLQSAQKRFSALLSLQQGEAFTSIGSTLGISSATLTRLNKALSFSQTLRTLTNKSSRLQKVWQFFGW